MTYLKKILFVFVALSVLSVCAVFVSEKISSAGTSATNAKGFETAFPLKLGDKTLSVRLALTEIERRQGLTGCRALEENSGMLFVYPDTARRGFWMRGVPINLSVGFFDANGKLLENKKMYADDFSVTYSGSEKVKFVLEMPEGWFEENSIRAGTSFSLDALSAFVAARGFAPEKFEFFSKE